MRDYHWLLERLDGRWVIAFGSYDRSDVTFERQDYREKGVKASDLRVWTGDDTDAAALAECVRLNTLV